eukprot:CAMPEP_0169168002 /NCGR_PEP_ID=MMETSP1015-20121227/60773_1 /TAXON_ID=342587 /ORGANISM="Karlodinium micrum, Strain CCMP2283" /LENGTH=242 /DNA_ID=CAMNT_0009240751 /DNA_START=55 /DNA_END=783 /DNA_ORIENTATION=+
MGAKCCSERKDNANSKERKSVAAYGGEKKRAISIGYHSRGDDAEKFDKAFESNDLKAFVSLLSSKQVIESFEERMHPWAEDPKTVGALAGTQLAILASVAEKENPRVKDDIRDAGAIPPLVDFLHLDSPVGGMRAAAATTLRNICMESDEYRKKFADLGGIKGLVGQLQTSPDPALNHADVQLEAVLNLQDIILDDNENVIKEFADLALKAGAEEKLRKLMKADDEEVRSSAQEVLECLQGS